MVKTKKPHSALSPQHQKMLVFFFVGVLNTLIDFIIYTIASSVFHIPLTLATVISGSISAITTFFTHGKITWKDREITKSSMLRFALWCLIMVTAIRPFIAFIAEHLTPLYQFIFFISSFLRLPFSYQFVTNTGVFIIIAAVVMTINFCVYEKFVFLSKSKKSSK